MTEDRRDVDRDIEETFGLVPEFFARVPDYLIPTEWASFKSRGVLLVEENRLERCLMQATRSWRR
jgi:hypothetical protein